MKRGGELGVDTTNEQTRKLDTITVHALMTVTDRF